MDCIIREKYSESKNNVDKTTRWREKIIPPIDLIFYPMIKLDIDNKMIDWSVFLINKQFIDDHETISEVGFLMSDAPHHLLKIGEKFTLYEGAKKIAYG